MIASRKRESLRKRMYRTRNGVSQLFGGAERIHNHARMEPCKSRYSGTFDPLKSGNPCQRGPCKMPRWAHLCFCHRCDFDAALHPHSLALPNNSLRSVFIAKSLNCFFAAIKITIQLSNFQERSICKCLLSKTPSLRAPCSITVLTTNRQLPSCFMSCA